MIAQEELLNYIQANYEISNYKAIRSTFKETPDVDISEVLTDFPLEDCVILFRLVANNDKTNVFSFFPTERQVEMLRVLPDSVSNFILNRMEPDDRISMLEEVSPEVEDAIIGALNPEERKITKQLLSYEEGSVGRLMTPYFVALSEEISVRNGLEQLKWNDLVPTEYLNQIYIINSKSELVGEIDLASMVVADPSSIKLKELMENLDVTLRPEQEQIDAVEAFRRYDCNFLPVVNEYNQLVGVVTADDVFDVAEEDATEDIQQFGGHGALEDSYFQTPLFSLFKKRVGWLLLLFMGTMFTGTVLRHYDKSLEHMIFLVFFLPLIVSSGGNSGTQAASLILRGIAINEMDTSDWLKILSREAVMGICLGLILGAMGYFRAYSWGYGPSIGAIVSVTLVIIVTLGTITGSMLPLLLLKTKLDPAVISSPFIATLLDIGGTIIFINIALLFLRYFNLS